MQLPGQSTMVDPPQPLASAAQPKTGCLQRRAVLKGPDFFFFLLRTALKDRPKGPPTANHQPPPTASHQPPPTASGGQPPTANHCQPPPTTNHQPPTATNHHQPPVANCQLPTANRQPPPTMVEHMECARAFLGKLVPEHFFFPVRTALLQRGLSGEHPLAGKAPYSMHVPCLLSGAGWRSVDIAQRFPGVAKFSAAGI